METSTVATPVASKVKSVQANGTYDSAHGTLFKFEYEMEDGRVLSANHKSQDGFLKVGESAEYTIKGNNAYGNYGSVSKPKPAFTPNGNSYKKTGGNASFALSYAKDLVVADKVDIKQILETAERLNNWLNSKS